MKRYLLLTGVAAASAIISVPALAQSTDTPEETVTVIVGEKGAAEDVEIELRENAPKIKREAGMPRFAIVGHDRKFYMGIGAQMNGVAAFDWGDEMPSTINFVPSSISPSTPGNRSNLGFSAATSNIYLNVVALPGTENRIGLFFKGKFSGANYGFKMSHFYVKYRGLTAGYANSLFEDGDAVPYTIDNQGPNGIASASMIMGSWEQDFGKGFSGAIGIEAPTIDMTSGLGEQDCNQRIPAIPLYLQYAYGGNSHIRASFIFRPMQYMNPADDLKAKLGWGVQLSGLTKITEPVTFYYSAVYGKGIANYLQDTEDLGLDAVPYQLHDVAKGARLGLPKSLGLTAGLGIQLSKKWQTNLTYSHLSVWYDKDSAVKPTNYRAGDYVAANVLYDLNRFLAFGIEYDYGLLKNFDCTKLHSNRLQGLVSVTF